jgi:hypothetical protein
MQVRHLFSLAAAVLAAQAVSSPAGAATILASVDPASMPAAEAPAKPAVKTEEIRERAFGDLLVILSKEGNAWIEQILGEGIEQGPLVKWTCDGDNIANLEISAKVAEKTEAVYVRQGNQPARSKYRSDLGPIKLAGDDNITVLSSAGDGFPKGACHMGKDGTPSDGVAQYLAEDAFPISPVKMFQIFMEEAAKKSSVSGLALPDRSGIKFSVPNMPPSISVPKR